MSSSVQVVEKATLMQRTVTFYHDVMAEMKKVTWPDWPQVRQLSIGVVVLALFIGIVIFILDNILRLVLVQGLPALFR
ncbi:MAG: preprotein translocase subunit SecE [Gemmatimonadota bacterium]|nr:preprotein translocase subunit SecE [Gemmatimonadota bacterium]